MSISVISQALAVDDVTSLVVTTIEQDSATGEYVREVRAFSTADGANDGIPKFRLQLRSATRAGVEYATPVLTL